MRNENQVGPICSICKQPITLHERPSKQLESGEEAHLACYLDSIAEQDKKKR